mmetsp:Transcript_39769/g.63202  ORF Transcript_39769/g.63202 Transcript_39769/m.63202 type:complete len:568 (+) Transcript_39769:80-1783(+)
MSTSKLDRDLHAQVLKREAVKEKAFREERQKAEDEFRNNLGLGGTEMTVQELKKVVDSDRRMYYRTLELNDKLYIHYKGWKEIKNLDEWIGLKTLYAECNAFHEISGLQNCTQLRSLFLQENCIKRISGLETLTQLWSLNLSNNFIEKIEGLSACTRLNTLTIARNKIGFGGVEDLEHLVDCASISTIDLQDNRIEDPDVLPEVFARMKDLRVLYLKGNPAAKKIVNYRKSLTVYCKDLRYIDDRPVFEDDRRCAEAFNRGGIEAERAEKKLIKQEKSDAHDRNMRLFNEMIESSRREKKERDAMRQEDKFTDDTDPVESFERRSKRLLDKWKEDNKEQMKDDAKEYAEKCLKAEREGKALRAEEKENMDLNTLDGDEEAIEESVDDDDRVDVASKEGDRLDSQKTAGVGDANSNRQDPEKKLDNRKLVYEDIWDDVPSVTSSAPSKTSSAPPKTTGNDEVFLPWAEGALGMDAVPPSQPALEQRKAALRSKAAESAETDPDESTKPSWHSKYLEKVAETQSKLQACRSQFTPPARVELPSEPNVSAEVGSAVDCSTGEAGELDEMD